MSEAHRKIILCSCETTMPLDEGAIGKACAWASITTADQLCRSEIGVFKAAAASGELTVACTQEAPLFAQIANEAGLGAALTFVNVREMAGWSNEARSAGPKMAALLDAATIAAPPTTAVTFESGGVALILGSDQSSIDAALQLKDALDITVIITGGAGITPPRANEIPIRFGRVRTVKGYLGAFEAIIDGFAEPLASSRANFLAGPSRNGAISKPDIIIDLTGNAPLFSAHELRTGYLRADPRNAAEVQRILLKAVGLTGTFDKPRYVTFKDNLCAHSRSRIKGCNRCLDVCPVGAIAPAGNAVAIDPYICGGCGACAAVCPTGAASYAMPPSETLTQRVRAAIVAYIKADGRVPPVVLFHDGDHGEELIFAASRFGDGLPAHVIALGLNEVTQLGLEQCVAALAYGAADVRVLTRAKPKHDVDSLAQTLDIANRLAAALGYGASTCQAIQTDDPYVLAAAVREVPTGTASPRPATFLPMGGKRDVLVLALRELHRAAPTPVENVPLPPLSPFGAVQINVGGCTLCLACVSACPPHALSANDVSPQLNFDESLCVQCGLCQATCPEKVITLEPRVNFAAFKSGLVILKEEEPFCCGRCAKPFGVRSTVERVIARLEGQHWMFSGANAPRLDLIRMCDTCRIEVATAEKMDPYAGSARPNAKTSADYLRDRETAMLEKIKKGTV